MAFMCFYNLIKYTDDARLKEEMQYSFYNYWMLEFPETNPFFNFAFAASNMDANYDISPWGSFDISPWEGWLQDSVKALKGFPLDRVSWNLQNSHRLDIELLPKQQDHDPYEFNNFPRGLRVNGKVLPIENRHFNHWSTDPFRLDYGGNGRTLSSGAVYTLPYYMGLFYGFIE